MVMDFSSLKLARGKRALGVSESWVLVVGAGKGDQTWEVGFVEWGREEGTRGRR